MPGTWAAISAASAASAGAARSADANPRDSRPQGQHRRLEPRRRLCARPRAAAAGHGALVITLGSPFANDITATNATRLYEALSGEGINDNPEIRDAIAGDLPVPATSIYSRTDGIVNWHTSLLRPSDTAENIEVYFASHIGLGVNPAAPVGGGRPAGAGGRGI
jgi:hypothetical protein